uniref:Uncharacterized protein n=1 Tax=Pseudomonas phage Cygsa01 TaxID=3138529 RepID=A0AAU6W3I0_9VIRU
MSFKPQKIVLINADGTKVEIECGHGDSLVSASLVQRAGKVYLCDSMNAYRSAIHFLEVPAERIVELPFSGASVPGKHDKLPHPDRTRMWQFIDNALQGTVEPMQRGEICNVLAPRLVGFLSGE